MKRISLILFFISAVFTGMYAQRSLPGAKQYCDLGITFEISNNPSWGYGEPVITSVQPFSPAEKAGLKVSDVIMEVNSTATYLRNFTTIANWLSDATDPEIKLTIRNLDTYFQEYTIQRICKSARSISEFNLATAYSFYSIENTNERAFSLPLKVDPNINVDFSDYHTFDFIKEGGNVPEMDTYINYQFEKALVARGLKRTSNDPDILIQTYYTYEPNVKYNPSTFSKNTKTWRYDPELREMVALPILSAEDPNAETKGQYTLELGVRFFDKKYIDKNKLTQIWDCNAREFLTDQFKMEDYAKIHAPLMLLQYPYSSAKSVAKYQVSFKTFNYTGLNYDTRDMTTIIDVDPGSPADLAGIRSGDVVVRINHVKFDSDLEGLENGYRRFIVETMPLRDKRSRFIDANGFPDCMYWQKGNYDAVASAFKKTSLYVPYFSYLYTFERYVSGYSTPQAIEIEVKSRDGHTRTVKVGPQTQKSIVLKAM